MQSENKSSGYQIRLFIAGQTSKSEIAIANIQHIFARLEIPLELIIVDVLEDPEVAEQFRILATPTLIKLSPLPVRRIIGDLSDERKLYSGLGIAR